MRDGASYLAVPAALIVSERFVVLALINLI